MAKKLTQETLETMVMNVLNESQDVNEIFGAIKRFMGGSEPTKTPMDRMRKGLDLSKFSQTGEFTAEEMLKRLANDPKLPKSLKQEIEVFFEPVYRKAQEPAPTAMMPTAKMSPSAQEKARLGTKSKAGQGSVVPTVKGTGFAQSDDETTAKMASPSYPKDKVPQPARKVAEGLNLEALVAEVLEEMSKKTPAKDTKKPVKK